MKILGIDDDVLTRRSVARVLVDDGHDVLTAPDETRGLELFRREQPEMVITDIVETILAIRRAATTVKIIAMAGHDTEMLETARLIRADDAIEKPFRVNELVQRVDALSAPTPTS